MAVHLRHCTMSEEAQLTDTEDLQERLAEVQTLLARHNLVEDIVHKQHLNELQDRLEPMHPADIAFVLEALPTDERLIVWNLVNPELEGEVLLEVSDAVRESLIASMERTELVAAAETLDADELADLAPDLPQGVIDDVFRGLTVEEREQLRAAMSYPDESVGSIMDVDMVTVREDVTLEIVLRYLRPFDELPDHTDQLFVVDRDEHLKGVLPLNILLVNEVDVEVGTLMQTDFVELGPDDFADEAAKAFERYDLVSAPVVDPEGKLVGRVTVNEVVDYIREEAEHEQLANAGLREEEDIFASVWDSVKNRWSWLAINLITAFFASRVIGAFEDSIEKLVALAALMPDRKSVV